MNKVEEIKREKDGLDAYADILRYAREGTPVDSIPESDLTRMKWFGLFHRPQKPGTFMLRLRITGGRLDSGQARVLAALARDYCGAEADITTRQNVQLRDILLPDAPAIFERLAAAGISTRQTGMDNVRNVVGCPLAGVDGAELFDATPVVEAVTAAHRAAGKEFSNLPRKFNVAISGCTEDCSEAETQDLGLVPAMSGDGARGFNVLAGGALGGTSPRLATPLDVFLRPAEAVPFFMALLSVYRDNGPRDVRTKARFKWLLDAWGEERVRGAIERELGYPLARAGRDCRRPPGGQHLGPRPQRQPGLLSVGLHVPVGRITAAQLEGLASVADRYGTGELRLTTGQNVIVVNVPSARIQALLGEPLLGELSPNPPPAWRNLVACTGRDYCHFSLIDTKARALELAAELERRRVPVPEGTRIHISGCVHACGKHHVADIGLQGAQVRLHDEVVEAADIYAGGRLGSGSRLARRVAQRVPMAAMADHLAAMLVGNVQQPEPAHNGELAAVG